MIKTYEMEMLGYENTFPVMDGNRKEYISFKKTSRDEQNGYLHTDKKNIQKAIEESDKFKKKVIKLVGTSGLEDSEEEEEEESKVTIHEKVTDIQSAREVLLGEPYNLKPQAVANNLEAVLKAAEKVGASFPNIK